jgi:hypothetical protein
MILYAHDSSMEIVWSMKCVDRQQVNIKVLGLHSVV